MFDLETVMSINPVTVGPSDPLHRAEKLMREHRIRHLPVVDASGLLVGLLTQTDLLAASDSFLRDSTDRLATKDFPVEDAMITDIATVPPTASLRQAALYLEKNRFGCLPVVADGKLAGIITDTDFVGIAINLLEQLEEGEPLEDPFEELE